MTYTPATTGTTVQMGTITVQGLNIFFREAGKPSNPKLVFLHGFPASSHQYRNLLPALADTFHVIAMDYPGFGNSDMPDPASYPYTFDTTAEVVQAFLSNTHDRALGIHIAPPSPPGQYLESWVEILFVKGFDAGQPIVYISTDAGQPLSAVLERSTYVPALDQAAYNGGDDFLGSARERLFGFVNGQTGADNREAQGFVHLVRDGHAAEDASASNTALIDALRNGGDLLNVFGDFPTETDPRHANAYSPLWDAQLGLWTDKAVKAGLNRRQIDEVEVFNLAATRPDLLTGVDPATGKPAPYGAAGVDINCAVIGFTDKAPTANLAAPMPNSQFPPR